MNNDKIVITGGLGFIGHNICIVLKNAGFNVHVIDNYSHNISQSWHKIIINERINMIESKQIPVSSIDTTDSNNLEKLLVDIKPRRIIHTAAIPDARLSNIDPSAGFDQNVVATKNILEIIRRNNFQLDQFTYLSSSMIYGDFKTETVDEEAPKNPKGIYGAAKLSSELLIKAYHNLIDLPYTIIRPSALYGPRCINNRVTQIFIERALQRKTIKIQGDGSQKLDFTFIEDFIKGFLITQTNLKAINQTFNLTTGHAEPINKLITVLKKYFSDLDVVFEPWDEIIPIRGTLSIERLKRLGFNPQNRIEDGYPKYVEWYLKNNIDFKIGIK